MTKTTTTNTYITKQVSKDQLGDWEIGNSNLARDKQILCGCTSNDSNPEIKQTVHNANHRQAFHHSSHGQTTNFSYLQVTDKLPGIQSYQLWAGNQQVSRHTSHRQVTDKVPHTPATDRPLKASLKSAMVS